MFNKNLQPIYDGKVLVNQSALENPVVQAALKEMSKRNFEPQEIKPLWCVVHLRQTLIMFNSMTQPMYIKGDYQLIARYNKFRPVRRNWRLKQPL
jgi:hypothetical protein